MLDFCVLCNSVHIEERVTDRTVDVGRYAVEVRGDHTLACLDCGEEFQTGAQAKEFDRKVVSARRHMEGLLDGDDIRRIRTTLGLSQADFEAALGIGPKTIIRWESNLTTQSKAIDDVLRLIDFDPANIRLLMYVRNAAKAELLDKKVVSKTAGKDERLRSAIHNVFEKSRSKISANETDRLVTAIFDAITRDREDRLTRTLAQEKQVQA
jgi:putative zinc finger/helix-turn-helix YgiT family protein